MRKFMILASAMLLVTMSQAVAISWNVSGLKTAGAGGTFTATALPSGVAYAFVGTASDRTAAMTAAAGGATSWSTYVAGYTSANKLGVDNTVAGGSLSVLTQGNFTANSSQSVFLIVFDNADVASAGNYMASNLFTQNIGAAASKTYTFGTPSATNTNFTATAWTVVPEPTSMALLAIGGAVFGLRRKFRK